MFAIASICVLVVTALALVSSSAKLRTSIFGRGLSPSTEDVTWSGSDTASEELKSADEVWKKAFKDKDIEMLMTLYSNLDSDPAILYPRVATVGKSDSPVIVGRTHIRGYFESLFSDSSFAGVDDVSLDYAFGRSNTKGSQGEKGQGYVTGTYSSKGLVKGEKETLKNLKYLRVYSQLEDGSWVIIHDVRWDDIDSEVNLVDNALIGKDKDFITYENSRNIDDMMSLYTDSSSDPPVLIYDGDAVHRQLVLIGRDDIKKLWSSLFFMNSFMDMEASTFYTTICDDCSGFEDKIGQGFTQGTISVQDKSGKSDESKSMNFVRIYRVYGDGKWKIEQEVYFKIKK